MKKLLTGILYTLFIIVCGAGCRKNDLLRYRSGGDIYFVLADTMRYSFARDTLTMAMDSIEVNITGPLAPVNRVFRLAVDDSLSTAVAGKHFLMINPDSIYIPAGKVNQKIWLTILRPADLYEKSVRLVLKLVPNTNFGTSVLTNKDGNAFIGSVVTKTIIVSDILRKPGIWDSNYKSLGSYSRKKLELVVKVCSLTLDGFYTEKGYSPTQLANFAVQMQRYLNKQKSANNPVLEINGDEMKMGPGVK